MLNMPQPLEKLSVYRNEKSKNQSNVQYKPYLVCHNTNIINDLSCTADYLNMYKSNSVKFSGNVNNFNGKTDIEKQRNYEYAKKFFKNNVDSGKFIFGDPAKTEEYLHDEKIKKNLYRYMVDKADVELAKIPKDKNSQENQEKIRDINQVKELFSSLLDDKETRGLSFKGNGQSTAVRELNDEEKIICGTIVHGSAALCGTCSAVMGEGAAIGADTPFLWGLQSLMFLALADTLDVPKNAATIYAAKEFASGAVVGVGAARVAVSWLGIGGHAATAGTGSVPITAGVRGVNSALSTAITEKMGWGFVKRVKHNRMNVRNQAIEAAMWAATMGGGEVAGHVFGHMAEHAEGIRNIFDAIPDDTRATIGALYSTLHEHDIDTYSGKFLATLITGYGQAKLFNRDAKFRDVFKDSVLNTAAYIVTNTAFDAPANEDILRAKQHLEADYANTPNTFRSFSNSLANLHIKQLENPGRDLLQIYKNDRQIEMISDWGREAVGEAVENYRRRH